MCKNGLKCKSANTALLNGHKLKAVSHYYLTFVLVRDNQHSNQVLCLAQEQI